MRPKPKTLSIENIPQPKRPEPTFKKLGLIRKAAGKMCTFRFRFEAIEALSDLTAKVNKRSSIKISKTQVLEILVIEAHKNPSHLIKLTKD